MDKKLKIILISVIAIIIYTAGVVAITTITCKNDQKKNVDKIVDDLSYIINQKTNNVVQEKEDTTDYKEFKENFKNTIENIKNKSK